MTVDVFGVRKTVQIAPRTWNDGGRICWSNNKFKEILNINQKTTNSFFDLPIKQGTGKDVTKFYKNKEFDKIEKERKDSIIINQDPKLLKVLELKKIVNQEVFTSGQYTIQIFSGNFTDYKILMDKLTVEEKYNEIFYSFETPYYKIRVGKYVSRILASKELKKIKKDFSSAFILQPK